MLVGLSGNDGASIDELLSVVRKMRAEKERSGTLVKFSKMDIIESFVGVSKSSKVDIKVPEICRNKGTGKRFKSGKEVAMDASNKRKRKCKVCGKTNHDKRTCPNKNAVEGQS